MCQALEIKWIISHKNNLLSESVHFSRREEVNK